ncbi:MAG: roadblock/LC7 domain-containing protein [Armatimonadota bacterium]
MEMTHWMEGYRCLLLAPDVTVTRLVEACLQREGMEVERRETSDLPEALHIQPPPDVIIADGDALPGREPQDFASEVDAPVVWMSSRTIEIEGIKTIRKPFSPPEMIMAVRDTLPDSPGGAEPEQGEEAPAPDEAEEPEAEPETPVEIRSDELDVEPLQEAETATEEESAPPEEHPSRPPRQWEAVVLDLCSGSGYSTAGAAESHGPDTLVVGIDRSEDAIMRAHRRMKELDITNTAFVVADVTKLPFADDSVDDATGVEELDRQLSAQQIGRGRAEINRVCGYRKWEDTSMTTEQPQAEQESGLATLRANNPDIRAAALVTEDGFAVEADCGPDVDEESLAALAADLLSRASRSSKEFDNGQLDELYARGPQGYLIVERAGEGQVLACLASAEATIGLLLRDVREAAAAASQ